jgi:small subunit ribosomal protein S16
MGNPSEMTSVLHLVIGFSLDSQPLLLVLPWQNGGMCMALRIRLQRQGRAHRPLFRIVVAESSARRDGRFVENLGSYNPCPRGREERFSLRTERAEHWLAVGAKPTDSVRSLIRDARRARGGKAAT